MVIIISIDEFSRAIAVLLYGNKDVKAFIYSTYKWNCVKNRKLNL